jgi:hypothetical protein
MLLPVILLALARARWRRHDIFCRHAIKVPLIRARPPTVALVSAAFVSSPLCYADLPPMPCYVFAVFVDAAISRVTAMLRCL